MEGSTSALAIERYSKVIEDYRSKLGENPDLKLREYCKETHTYYRGLIDWLERYGPDSRGMKSEACVKNGDGTAV